MRSLQSLVGGMCTALLVGQAAAGSIVHETELDDIPVAELQQDGASDESATAAVAEAVSAAGLATSSAENLAERVVDLLGVMSSGSPQAHIDLMESWGGTFETTAIVAGDVVIDPLEMWPDSVDDDAALHEIDFSQIHVQVRQNVQPEPISIEAAEQGKRLSLVAPQCFANSPFPAMKDRTDVTLAQVWFDVRTNDDAELKLGFAMRWEESVNAWIPIARFVVHDSDAFLASYLF